MSQIRIKIRTPKSSVKSISFQKFLFNFLFLLFFVDKLSKSMPNYTAGNFGFSGLLQTSIFSFVRSFLIVTVVNTQVSLKSTCYKELEFYEIFQLITVIYLSENHFQIFLFRNFIAKLKTISKIFSRTKIFYDAVQKNQ